LLSVTAAHFSPKSRCSSLLSSPLSAERETEREKNDEDDNNRNRSVPSRWSSLSLSLLSAGKCDDLIFLLPYRACMVFICVCDFWARTQGIHFLLFFFLKYKNTLKFSITR
jgi:hypothetical protein